MKVRELKKVRLKRWASKAAKVVLRFLISTLVSVLVMIVVIDCLGVFFGQDTARDIATRAAVVASQVIEDGGDNIMAEKQALREVKRNLAELKNIKFADKKIEVIVVIHSRSIILKHIPWVRKITTITSTGSNPY